MLHDETVDQVADRAARCGARGAGDAGQLLPLAALAMALAVVLALLAVELGVVAGDAARAQIAADAAALAGASAGPAAAAEMAGSNGARLLEFRRDGALVLVEVRVGRVVRAASAAVESRWSIGSANSTTSGPSAGTNQTGTNQALN